LQYPLVVKEKKKQMSSATGSEMNKKERNRAGIIIYRKSSIPL